MGADRRVSQRHPVGVAASDALAAQRVEQLHRLVRVAAGVRCDRLGQLAGRARGPRAASRRPGRPAGHGQVVQLQVRARRSARATATSAPSAGGSHRRRPRGSAPTSSSPSIGSSPSSDVERSRAGCCRPTAGRRRTNTTGRCGDAAARRISTAMRCARTCAVSGSPGSGGTPSSAANSGSPRRPCRRSDRVPRSIRSRTAASSSSGSASSSRPSARNAWWTPSNSRSRRYWSNLPATNQPSRPVTTGRSSSTSAVLPTPGAPPTSTPRHSPGPRGLERRLQRRHLAVAAHQPRRRQQPQRDVPLADPERAGCAARIAVAQPLQVVDQPSAVW